MDDDDSSHYVRFTATVPRPAGMRPCVDARLLDLNAGAAWGMMELVSRYKIDPDGSRFWNLPAPDEARQALLDWLYDISDEIERYGLESAAIDAVFPVPDGVDHQATVDFWTSPSLPPYNVLVHVLFSLGIGSHVVTGAALLWHRASHPMRTKTDNLVDGDEHETSDINRPAVRR